MKKPASNRKKLSLDRQTVRNLDTKQLGQILGGAETLDCNGPDAYTLRCSGNQYC